MFETSKVFTCYRFNFFCMVSGPIMEKMTMIWYQKTSSKYSRYVRVKKCRSAINEDIFSGQMIFQLLFSVSYANLLARVPNR